jgi:hypothetical protein
MKLRITPNSIRFRMNQIEVARFAEAGEIRERIMFPGRTAFSYGLQALKDSVPVHLRFDNCKLTVMVPQAQVKAWASREQEVGLYYGEEIEDGGTLRIMIEKDFQCVDGPPEEVDPAGYPNPRATAGCNVETK